MQPNTEPLFLLLIERVGKQFSLKKIANILKISPDSAKRYLMLFENTYLINLISRYGKTNEKILSPKKVYIVDLGIKSLFSGFRDIGSIFENYVYNLIKQFNPEYLYKEGVEIDFIIAKKALIEVKYGQNLTKKQKKLFDQVKIPKKFIIKDYNELTKMVEQLGSG